MDDSNTLIPRQDRVVCSGNTRYDIATGRCEIPPDGDGAKSLENPLGIVTSRTTNLSTATLAMGEADSTTTIIRASNSPDVQTTRVLSENGVGLQASPTVTLANTSSIPTNAATVISNDSNGNRLSSGAVAGIAIGTLLVGAILAFFAAMFVFKRRQRSRAAGMGNAKGYTSYADSSPELVTIQQAKMVNVGGPNSPYVQVSQSPIPSTMATAVPVTLHHRRNLSEGNSSFLPPAAHDTVIHSRVSTLFNNLHRHVETYYRDVHATITPSMESDLARFGAKGNNMVEMVQDCSAPTTALKHAIVAYVLGITSASSKNAPDPTSLFPSALVSPRRDASAGTLSSKLLFYLSFLTLLPSLFLSNSRPDSNY